jgi:CheY-like chemotaxis protein
MAMGFKKSILVIENDSVTRNAVALALQDDGYSAMAVANGHEALLHLRGTSPDPLL